MAHLIKAVATTIALAALPFAARPAQAQIAGTGLKAEYFDNADFSSLKLTRTDAAVNFQWGTAAPATGLGADTFSVCWSGQVQPRYSQAYTFSTVSNDGVRLWVNGQKLIDNWSLHPATENRGSITLTANTRYDIKMEYFDDTASATAQLLWSSASQAKQIIPQSQLFAPATIMSLVANAVPSVSIAKPLNNAVMAAPASFTLVANAADADGTIAKVEFFKGSTSLGVQNVAPYDLPLSNLAPGSYSFCAKATDNKGAVTCSAPLAVTVKTNAPPTVSMTTPTNSRFLPTSSIHLTADAADDGQIAQVEFFRGNTSIAVKRLFPYDIWAAALPLGTYSVWAKATDNSGATTSSAPITLIVANNEAPDVRIVSPVEGANVPASTPLNIHVEASDIDGTVNRVQFYKGTSLLSDQTQEPWDFSWSTDVAGSYTFKARAMDNRGVWTYSAPVTISVERFAEENPLVTARLPRLTHGVNVEDWFKYSYHPYSDAELDNMVSLGFQHIRLPIGIHLLFNEASPDQPNPTTLAQLDTSITRLLARNLAVIICPFDADERFWSDPATVANFARFWRAFAAHLSSRRADRVFLETLNEPYAVSAQVWDDFQAQILAAMREGAPNHTLIAHANMTNSQPAAILQVVPVADTNVVYNFHFYKASPFTHQGGDWGNPAWAYLHDLPYPSSPEKVAPILPTISDPAARDMAEAYGNERYDAAKLESWIAPIARWAAMNKVRVTCNEFGVYRNVAPALDRNLWIRDTGLLLEKYGIGWTMWEYDNNFGIFKMLNGQRVIDDGTMQALGL